MINYLWDCLPLGEVFEIRAGKGTPASARNGEVQYPFLRTSNVLWDSIDLSSVAKISLHAKELIEKKLVPGDLLVCGGGEVGRAAIWNGQCEIMYLQDHLYRLRPLRKDVVPRFYVFFLQSAFTQLNIYGGVANKTTIPGLPQNRLANLKIPVPPKKDQEKIVFALHTLRTVIQVNDKLLKASNELKHATMHKLFPCGLRGEPQKQTEIGLVPVSWPLIRLGDAYYTQRGKNLSPKARLGDSPKPYLRNKNVQWGYLDLSDMHLMDFDERESLKFRLVPGDLLICAGGAIGRAAIWRGELNECYYQGILHRARPRSGAASNEYLYYWLSFSFENQNLYNIKGTGSTITHLPQVLLREFSIPLPSRDQQQEIVDILDAIDQKIDLHRRKKAVLEELFKSLLYKLMTGEVRVDDLDLFALEGRKCHEN